MRVEAQTAVSRACARAHVRKYKRTEAKVDFKNIGRSETRPRRLRPSYFTSSLVLFATGLDVFLRNTGKRGL